MKKWILLVAILGYGLTALLFQNLQITKSHHIESIVSNTSDHYRKILEAKLSSLFREMDVARHLYQSSNTVNIDTFRIVARPMVESKNGLVALEWIPRIAKKDLQNHLKLAQSSGLENYFVKEKSASGEFISVPPRPYYYPVYFSEPEKSETSAQGYDIGSNPDRLFALLKAMEKNITVATVPLTLSENKLLYDTFLIFKPVYQNSKSIETQEERISHLKGFVVGVFSTKALINSAFGFLDNPNNSITLNDITEPISYNARHRIFDTGDNAYIQSTLLAIADHQWKLTIELQESLINNNSFFEPIVALIIGFFITVILVFYVYSVSSNIYKIKQKVEEQTSQQQKNDQLQRNVLKSISNAVITVNAEGIIEDVNQATETIFGYQVREVMGKNINIFIPSPHNRIHDQYISQYLRTGKSEVVGRKRSATGRHKLGHDVNLELTITEINSRSQPFFCVIVEDMSTQMESEKLSNRLLEITKISPDFIATFDTEGHLVFANDPARKALGCRAKEDISKRRLDNIFPSTANDFFQKSKRYPDYLHSWIGESVFVTAEGVATSVSQLLLSHACHEGEIQYYTTFMRDISEEKKAQIDVRRAQQIEQNTAISQGAFLREMIDKIKNPASDILGYIQLLYDTDLNSTQLAYVTKLHASEQNIQSFLQGIQKYQDINSDADWGITEVSDKVDHADYRNETNPISTSSLACKLLPAKFTSIDAQILKNLKQTMSSSEYNNMLPRYVSDTERNIESMCAACRENHYQEIEKIAQQIKSSSANIGIQNLSDLANTLEHDIHNQHWDKISTQLNDIENEFSIVRDHLQNEYISHNKAS